jgi:ATP-binding cassette subfamily B protein
MVNNIGYSIVAGAGGWMAVQGLATVRAIASFVDYSRRLSRPLNDIASMYNSIQSAIAAAERAFGLLDEVPEPADAPAIAALRPIAGEVVFDDVSFGYDAGVPVLTNVSLRARPGQTVALVGPTGAGKTTMVNLLERFYDIEQGRIAIDGRDILSVRKDSLRRQLDIVLQDTFLFSATVMDNIRYGRLDATTRRWKRPPGWPMPISLCGTCLTDARPWWRSGAAT